MSAEPRPLALLELLEAMDRFEFSDGADGLNVQRWVNDTGTTDEDATKLIRGLIVGALRGYSADQLGQIILDRLEREAT